FLGLLELVRDNFDRLGPGDRFKLVAIAEHRRLQAIRMIDEIECIAALHAEKLAVDPAAIAIVATDDLSVADTERGAAAIGTVRADRADVFHLPRASLITINSACQGTHWANIDAGTAFVALEVVVTIGDDLGNHPAIRNTECANPH